MASFLERNQDQIDAFLCAQKTYEASLVCTFNLIPSTSQCQTILDQNAHAIYCRRNQTKPAEQHKKGFLRRVISVPELKSKLIWMRADIVRWPTPVRRIAAGDT